MAITLNNDDEDLNHALLPESSIKVDGDEGPESKDVDLASRVWIESKKLWRVVGPELLSRFVTFFMSVIIQAFVGNLGDIELAAFSIGTGVISGISFGLMLGMASALETLCGQAFGAKRYHMLGIYLQRSWIVLFICSMLLLPVYIFSAQILKLVGLPDEVAEVSGLATLWLIPLHFIFVFQFPLQRFLQSQLKNIVITWATLVALPVCVLSAWLLIHVWDFGLVGAVVALDIGWGVLAIVLFGYLFCGGCPLTWTGFSVQAFSGLWEFIKLSAASGVMLCLESWYYRILTLMTGYLKNAVIAVDAFSICMSICFGEMMIHLAFLAGAGVRVANELGAGNAKGAKFATIVSISYSSTIGILFCILIIVVLQPLAQLFTSSTDVLQEIDKMWFVLGAAILLNSVQPVLSGVAVGSGRQATVAYINLGCYYIIGVPIGAIMGWVFNLGVTGLWSGMIFGGTAIQTVILAIMTIRTDWEKQVESATKRASRWSDPKPDDHPEVQQ